MFVSKDENLTKAHARYLEARLIALAKEAKRATVANGTEPPAEGRLPESDGVEMEEFIGQVRLLLGTLGYDILEPLLSPSPAADQPVAPVDQPEFRYEGEGFSARCVVDLDAGQFVVKAGSTARSHESAMAFLIPTKLLLSEIGGNDSGSNIGATAQMRIRQCMKPSRTTTSNATQPKDYGKSPKDDPLGQPSPHHVA